MRTWAIRFTVVALCLCLAAPVLAADQGESVWAKYNMKIWGRVKFDIHYDTAQFINYNDFLGVPADRIATANARNNSTNFNPRDSRLGFSASHAVGEWAGRGVIELDFYGTNSGDNLIPRMRLAYVELANKDWGTSVRAGQDWQPIFSTNPSTIDFGILSATGNLWWRRPQVTVRQKFGVGDAGGFELLGSLMLKRRTSTASETRMPWLLGRLAYNFEAAGKHMLALSGGYQSDSTTAGDDLDRWLFGGEFKLNFSPVLVKGEIFTGSGIGGDFLRYGLDTFVDGAKTKTWDGSGGWIDATVRPMKRWSITAGVGIDNPKKSQYRRATISAANINRTFTRSYNFFANTWWSLGPDTKVGVEFMHLEAERKDLADNEFTDKGQRYTMSIYYGF